MAKKILYKVTSYHCPRCGGVTEPTKKYCDYCERELLLDKYIGNKLQPQVRMLIDCGRDFVNFNTITNIEGDSTPNYIDCTTLEDSMSTFIVGANLNNRLTMQMPTTSRTRELIGLLDFSKNYKIRVEIDGGNRGFAFENEVYFVNFDSLIKDADSMMLTRLNMVMNYDDLKLFDSCIPNEVLKEARCPNCGAPMNNRLCACQYCGGWSQIEW